MLNNISCFALLGDGDPPGNARKFVKKLLDPANASSHMLKGMRYALLGLGDTNYTNFCGGPKRLEKALKKQGASSFYDTAYADDGTDLEDTVEPWIEKLFEGGVLDKFLVDFERSQSVKTSGNDNNNNNCNKDHTEGITDALDSKLVIKENETFQEIVPGNPSLIGNNSLSSVSLSLPPLFPVYLQFQYEQSKQAPEYRVENAAKYTVASGDAILCRVSSALVMTRHDAVKKCIEMKLTSDDMFPYSPGDSFGLCCHNSSVEVDWLIKRLF